MQEVLFKIQNRLEIECQRNSIPGEVIIESYNPPIFSYDIHIVKPIPKIFQEQLSSLNSSTTNPKRGLPAQNVLPSWKWMRSNPDPS